MFGAMLALSAKPLFGRACSSGLPVTAVATDEGRLPTPDPRNGWTPEPNTLSSSPAP